jgi:hypothetical protein
LKKQLEDALFAAHPTIFARHSLPPEISAMGWGTECDDGWYEILAVLCDVLDEHAASASHPPVEASQVKQKLGGLRFYTHSGCGRCHGAIAFACAISHHVCEISGRPGVRMARRSWRKTLAEDVGVARGFAPRDTAGNRIPIGSGNGEEPPEKWAAIVAALDATIMYGSHPARFRLVRADGDYRIECAGETPEISGALCCARAFAARTTTWDQSGLPSAL